MKAVAERSPGAVFSAVFVFLLAWIAVPQAFAAKDDCSQPVSGGDGPVTSDCLHILSTAVGSQICETSCVCDVNGSNSITSIDALMCLRAAVDLEVDMNCPCGDTTTTTIEVTTTTTTTTTTTLPVAGVMNEACPVCHGDGRVIDVASYHPGLQTIPDINASIDSVAIVVDDVAHTARLTVNFTVTDPDGDPIPDLGAPSPTQATRFAYLRFALSELEPAEDLSGDPDSWVSYTTGDRTPANLTDHGDGTYTYLLATNLYTLYIPSLRHRLLMTVSGAIVAQSKNVTYDFVPEQLPGPFVFDTSRDIVTTTACNSCHGRLGSTLGDASFHGGSRYTTEACATCHTTSLVGGSAEFAPMVHKIHAAQNIEGLADFSEVTYPQDVRNCATCHAGTDGSNWYTRPSQTACGSCHADVDFVTGENHDGGPQTNAACVDCHSEDAIKEVHVTDISTPHNPDVPEGAVSFEYVLEEVTVNDSRQAVVRFHINADGEPVDLSTIPPAGFSGGPGFLVAYALPQDGVEVPVDYNNLGRSAGQPATVTLASLSGKLTGTPESYTAVLDAAPFPSGATMRAVALQGYFTQLMGNPASTTDDLARHTPSVVQPVTGDPVRRQVVEVAKCLNCHESLELHGGNRVNNVQVCVTCHDPNLSSSGRTVNPADVTQEQKDALAAAGHDPNDPLSWPETSMQLKNLVHGLHSSGMRNFDYDFVRNRNGASYFNWSEVTFPGILSNCETCHLPGTYGVDLPDGVLVSTNVTTSGPNATRASILAARDSVPNDTDEILSPTAGPCSMCHDSVPAAAHMEQNGGVIGKTRLAALGN